MLTQAQEVPVVPELLDRLRALCERHAEPAVAQRLSGLLALLVGELGDVETELTAIESDRNVARRAAGHLLLGGGKRLRPLCVLVAARAGSRRSPEARNLATAVELVHNATLLHDDVVDGAPTRRGRPTSRVLFGNTAAIFAGDLLLIEALRRVRRIAPAEVFDGLLDTIEDMIEGETLQLELQGSIETSREQYFRIVEGKSATLFRWAMYSGARLGGLNDGDCARLQSFGGSLGTAFQFIDDLLDFNGDRQRTGKRLFADLWEGKMTLPLIIAREREPAMRLLLNELLAAGDEGASAEDGERITARVMEAIGRTGALEECRKMARDMTVRAVQALSDFPLGEARETLELVARVSLHRDW